MNIIKEWYNNGGILELIYLGLLGCFMIIATLKFLE